MTAELLGAPDASVRIAGVYAFAALANDAPEARQGCIDVLCAYLRQPYGAGDIAGDGREDGTADGARFLLDAVTRPAWSNLVEPYGGYLHALPRRRARGRGARRRRPGGDADPEGIGSSWSARSPLPPRLERLLLPDPVRPR